MKNNISIKISINNRFTWQKANEAFYSLVPKEKYEIIKNNILKSDTVIFFMTSNFLKDVHETPFIQILKKSSEKYENVTVIDVVSGHTEYADHLCETLCYSLDISTNEGKKLFLDNYCFFEHEKFLLVLPELDSSLKIADNYSYEPYSFFFLSNMQVNMYIEHHTRRVTLY